MLLKIIVINFDLFQIISDYLIAQPHVVGRVQPCRIAGVTDWRLVGQTSTSSSSQAAIIRRRHPSEQPTIFELR